VFPLFVVPTLSAHAELPSLTLSSFTNIGSLTKEIDIFYLQEGKNWSLINLPQIVKLDRVSDGSSAWALKVGTTNNGNTMAAVFYTAGMIKTCMKSIVLSTHLSTHAFYQNPPFFLLMFDSYFCF
jgi:hypothetical protein